MKKTWTWGWADEMGVRGWEACMHGVWCDCSWMLTPGLCLLCRSLKRIFLKLTQCWFALLKWIHIFRIVVCLNIQEIMQIKCLWQKVKKIFYTAFSVFNIIKRENKTLYKSIDHDKIHCNIYIPLYTLGYPCYHLPCPKTLNKLSDIFYYRWSAGRE